jgi:hypothetical protein
MRVCGKNVSILFFRYFSLRLPSPHPHPASPLKGEKPYAFGLFWTKTLTVFPPLQGEGRVGVGSYTAFTHQFVAHPGNVPG